VVRQTTYVVFELDTGCRGWTSNKGQVCGNNNVSSWSMRQWQHAHRLWTFTNHVSHQKLKPSSASLHVLAPTVAEWWIVEVWSVNCWRRWHAKTLLLVHASIVGQFKMLWRGEWWAYLTKWFGKMNKGRGEWMAVCDKKEWCDLLLQLDVFGLFGLDVWFQPQCLWIFFLKSKFEVLVMLHTQHATSNHLRHWALECWNEYGFQAS